MTPLSTSRHRLFAACLAAVAVISMTATGCRKSEPRAAGQPKAFRVVDVSTLASYRYTVEVRVEAGSLGAANNPLALGSIQMRGTGAYVAPDRTQSATTANLGIATITTETIRIGTRQWSREGTGTWHEGAGSGSLLGEVNLSPSGLFSNTGGQNAITPDEVTQRLEGRPYTTETAAGVQTRHYAFDRAGFEAVFGARDLLIGGAADNLQLAADVWFAEREGAPLRMLLVGKDATGREVVKLDVAITELNSTAISIQPPI